MDVVNKVVMKKINEIKPYMRNGRKNEKTVKLLVKIIPKVGFNVPIVIDKKGIIVKGHARYIAAIRLGMTEVPCVVTNADEDTVKLNRIADNVVSEFSEWLTDDLLDELQKIDIDFDMSELDLPDFKAGVVEDANADPVVTSKSSNIAVSDKTEAQMPEEIRDNRYYRITCPDCGKMSYIAYKDAKDVEPTEGGEQS